MEERKHTDRGYAWVVLCAATLMFMLQGSVFYTMSFMYGMVKSQFNLSNASASSIGAVFSAVNYLTGPFLALASHHITIRRLAMIGGFIYAIGFVIASFANGLALAIIGYGIIAGTGGAIAEYTGFLIITEYFDSRRSLAMGILTSGITLASLLFPKIISFIYHTYSYFGGLLIHGAIVSHIIAFGMFFKPNIPIKTDTTRKEEDDKAVDELASTPSVSTTEVVSKKTSMKILMDQLGLSYATNIHILSLTLAVSAQLLSWTSCVVFLSPFASETASLSQQQTATIITIGGGINLVCKLLCSHIFDLSFVKKYRAHIYPCLSMSAGFLVLTSSTWTSFIVIAIFYCIMVSLTGLSYGLSSVVLADVAGESNFNKALGFLQSVVGLVEIIGIQLAGKLVDKTGSFLVAFYFVGTTQIVAAVVFFMTHTCYCQRERKIKRGVASSSLQSNDDGGQ